MDFLGIGSFELILILIVFFIFVGPAKLPEVAAMIGKGMRKFREASAELNRGLKDMADEVKEAGAEVGKEVGQTSKPGTALTSELREVSREIEGAVKDAGASVKSAARGTRSPAPRTGRTTPGASGDKPKQGITPAEGAAKESPGRQAGDEEG
jgi:sec-independent protein translocase protein TatB